METVVGDFATEKRLERGVGSVGRRWNGVGSVGSVGRRGTGVVERGGGRVQFRRGEGGGVRRRRRVGGLAKRREGRFQNDAAARRGFLGRRRFVGVGLFRLGRRRRAFGGLRGKRRNEEDGGER